MSITRAKVAYRLNALSVDDLTVDIIASTFAVNSYGYRVLSSGADLGGFVKNPVICYGHDDRGEVAEGSGLPIAKALVETIRVEGDDLRMKIQFTPQDVNPFGYKVFRMVQSGFISGVSIGFDPVEWDDQVEFVDGEKVKVRVCTKWRLIEVSIVTCPSNGDAMVEQGRKLSRESDVEKFRTLAREIEAEAESISSRSPATVEDLLVTLSDSPAKELVAKHLGYFERKQPVNKVASRVMKKYFERVLNREQPDDEKLAWEEMEEEIDKGPEETVKVEPEAQESAPEQAEAPKEEIKEVEVKIVEVKTEEPQSPSNQTAVAEDPQPAPEAPVRMSVDALRRFHKELSEALTNAAVEALRRGTPRNEVGGLLDAVAKGLRASYFQ